nr:hypothetical protein [Tanacetum cinerariifolium]
LGFELEVVGKVVGGGRLWWNGARVERKWGRRLAGKLASKQCISKRGEKTGAIQSIEDEEVSLVDGVLEGALGALEALEMESLVDAMDVDNG